MNSFPRRLLAVAVLLLTMFPMSGASLAGATLPALDTLESCCLPFNQDKEPSPCATPDCLCLLCLNLHLTRFTDIAFLPLSFRGQASHLRPRPLAAFGRAIDYPPEHS
ncbi:hypothetical protein ACUUL3_01410 [Thiovibrio sp. JS02]